jgi:hypothetical protein
MKTPKKEQQMQLAIEIYSFMKLLNEYQIPAIDDYDIEAELNTLKGL